MNMERNWAHATLPLYGVGNGYLDTSNERFPLLEHLMLPSEPASMYLLGKNWFPGFFWPPLVAGRNSGRSNRRTWFSHGLKLRWTVLYKESLKTSLEDSNEKKVILVGLVLFIWGPVCDFSPQVHRRGLAPNVFSYCPQAHISRPGIAAQKRRCPLA
jgi:hypothetical protein